MKQRQVERFSSQLAERCNEDDYHISHNYLANLEAVIYKKPSLCKIYTLSVAYGADLFEMLQLFGMSREDLLRAEHLVELPATNLHFMGASEKEELELIRVPPRGLSTEFDRTLW